MNTKNNLGSIFILIGLAGLGLASPAPHAKADIDKPLHEHTVANGAAPQLITVAQVKNGIVPHRALYKLSMVGTKNGSTISDIAGRMYYSWADDCDAWNVQQAMQIRFFTSEGEVNDTSSSLISRESKDGSTYYFHVKRSGESDQPDVSRGSALISADASGTGIGDANATGGKDTKKYSLTSATTFPAHHTMQILAHALSGQKFFAVNVFDGADENGLNEISTFIGSPIAPDAKMEKTATAQNPQDALTHVRAWPVRMAFFAPDSTSGAPDYEMDVTLLENGIIKDMTIDYDDFTMRAELDKVEAIPPSKCNARKGDSLAQN